MAVPRAGVSSTGLDDVPADAQARIERLVGRYAVTLRSVAGAGAAVIGLLVHSWSIASLAVLLILLAYSLLRLRGRKDESPEWPRAPRATRRRHTGPIAITAVTRSPTSYSGGSSKVVAGTGHLGDSVDIENSPPTDPRLRLVTRSLPAPHVGGLP